MAGMAHGSRRAYRTGRRVRVSKNTRNEPLFESLLGVTIVSPNGAPRFGGLLSGRPDAVIELIALLKA